MPTVAEDLDRMTKAQLRAEARLRGLSDGGTKDALLRRLRDADDEDEEFDDEPRDEDEDFDEEDDEPRDEDEGFDDDSDDEDDEEFDDEPRDEDEEFDEDDDDEDDEEFDDEPRDEDEEFDEDDDVEDDEEFDDEPRDLDDDDVEDDEVFDDEPRDEDEDFDEDDEDLDEDDEPQSSSNGHRKGGLGSLVSDARETLEALTGRSVDAVSGIEQTDEGYQVTLEVLEVERVPATTDVLATYVVQVDDDGDVQSFTKTNRYYRNQRLGD